MSINWDNLREWNGSIATAFEELCCQLAACEAAPSGSRFFRKGTPDAGVECYWQLPDESEWAWQAKWFRNSPTNAQWKDIDESVSNAIDKHPKLKSYTVCLPVDRSDARIGRQKTFMDKWEERVARWEKLASAKGMEVAFTYWGASEIGTRLSEERHRGRHWFWFSEERFSPAWFVGRADEAIENARERYSPSLNVDLPIGRNFDALSRSNRFVDAVADLYSELRIKARKVRPLSDPPEIADQHDRIKELVAELLDHLGRFVSAGSSFNEWGSLREMPWDVTASIAREVIPALGTLIYELHELRETQNSKESRPGGDLGFVIHTLSGLRSAIMDLASFVRSVEGQLANLPAMLLVGEAGQGKTHLLCHVVSETAAEGRPCVLIHGEQFRDGEPWSQIIEILGLHCGRDEFLGALEAAGQASNCRALLCIDAINEGAGNRLWWKFLPGMLKAVAESAWVGICVSVRTTYESLVVPTTLDKTRLVRVRHNGFAEVAYEAAGKFFDHYEIEPSAPLLLPEFTNPLFLKLFCGSLRNVGLSRVPDGLRGLTSVFEFYLQSIDKKLCRPEWLDYDERTKAVETTVARFAEVMASRKSDRLSLTEAQQIANKVLPRSGYQQSLFRHLESEGVITVFPHRSTVTIETDWQESVRFTYQRFSDHLIVQHLVSKHLDCQEPAASFSPHHTLGKLVKNETECQRNRGLFEALAIQVPELTGKELFELVEHLGASEIAREVFVESLVWRDATSLGRAAEEYIENEVLKGEDVFDDFWDATLMLATTPRHPLNADRLHSTLMQVELPDRDAWWSTFLHREWGRKRAVDRLVEWASEQNNKTIFCNEVVRLASTTLTWFLTSANRFLRDRATQGLVRLLEDRLDVLQVVLTQFEAVDDPYVTERLYAVAYGCAMRTQDLSGLAELGSRVFHDVFENGVPPTHILTRDYARGTVEVAVQRADDCSLDLTRIAPPYRSAWPSLEIPSEEEVERLGAWDSDMPEERWALQQIHSSVVGQDDFSRYVIKSMQEFTSTPLGEPTPQSRREIQAEFVESLTARQREAWDLYCDVVEKLGLYRRMNEDRRKKVFPQELSNDQIESILGEVEQELASRLRQGSRKHKLFYSCIKEHVAEPHRFIREHSFDGKLARRWIMKRILDLGWTTERFAKFDRSISSQGRDARKPERIGKKYQWIAYHELLARLADNFHLDKPFGAADAVQYDEPGDAGARRDIDPSLLLRKTHREEWKPHTNTWWFTTAYSEWDDPEPEPDWLKRADNLPNAAELIEVVHAEDGTEWLTLHGYYHWEQPTPVGEDRSMLKRRDLSYLLHCYLTPVGDSDVLLKWAAKQSWMGRWMPEDGESYGVFLGEFFWARSFQSLDAQNDAKSEWTRGDADRIPAPVRYATCEYVREASGFDCSLDETVYISLPCRFIAEGMKLTPGSTAGSWVSPTGELVALDPSVAAAGPRVLLMKRAPLERFLKDQGLTLFWAILGEKMMLGGMDRSEDYNGYLEVSGAYILKGNELVGNTRFDFRPPGYHD